MANIERTEAYIEGTLEQLEPTTEQIEREMEEVEQRIQKLEADLAAVQQRGDSKLAGSMQASLERERAEKRRIAQQAQQEIQKVESLMQRIREVDQWNTEAQKILAEQARLGIPTDRATEKVYQRQRWVEKEWDEAQDKRQRLSKLVGT